MCCRNTWNMWRILLGPRWGSPGWERSRSLSLSHTLPLGRETCCIQRRRWSPLSERRRSLRIRGGQRRLVGGGAGRLGPRPKVRASGRPAFRRWSCSDAPSIPGAEILRAVCRSEAQEKRRPLGAGAEFEGARGGVGGRSWASAPLHASGDGIDCASTRLATGSAMGPWVKVAAGGGCRGGCGGAGMRACPSATRSPLQPSCADESRCGPPLIMGGEGLARRCFPCIFRPRP